MNFTTVASYLTMGSSMISTYRIIYAPFYTIPYTNCMKSWLTIHKGTVVILEVFRCVISSNKFLNLQVVDIIFSPIIRSAGVFSEPF